MSFTLIGRDLRTRALHETALPPAYAADAMPGAQLLGSDGRIYRSERYPTVSDPYQWISAVDIAEDVAADVFRPVVPGTEITVGTGGDFPSVLEAWAYSAGFAPSIDTAADHTAPLSSLVSSIRILSGHVETEQIITSGVNLAHVRMWAEDGVLPLDVTNWERYFTSTFEYRLRYWVRADASSLPRMDLKLVETGTRPVDPFPDGTGVFSLGGNSSVVFQDDPLVDLTGDLSTVAFATGIEGFDVYAQIATGATFTSNGSSFEDARHRGFLINNGGTATIAGRVRCAPGALNSFRVAVGGGLRLSYCDYRLTAGVDSVNDLRVTVGGTAYLQQNVVGGTNIPPHDPSRQGAIYNATVTSPLKFSGFFLPQPYTVGTVPSAAAYPAHMIYVSDGDAGAPCLALSNGTNWLRIAPGAAVSTT